jgi:hypothetical protein
MNIVQDKIKLLKLAYNSYRINYLEIQKSIDYELFHANLALKFDVLC